MTIKIEFDSFTAELVEGTTLAQAEIFIETMKLLGYTLKAEGPKGVWFVYGYDTSPFPLYMSDNKEHVDAYVAGEGLTYQPWVVFWPFSQSFSNVILWQQRQADIHGGE